MLDNPLNDLSQLLYPLSTLVFLSRASPYRRSRPRASPGNPFASSRRDPRSQIDKERRRGDDRPPRRLVQFVSRTIAVPLIHPASPSERRDQPRV